MGIVRSSPILARRHIYSDVRAPGQRGRNGGEKIYARSHNRVYVTRTLQPALAPLARGSALAFQKYHSRLLATFRFNMFPPFVRDDSSLRRALRGFAIPSLPKFVRGSTFERSSVKKPAIPLENYALTSRFITFLSVIGGWVEKLYAPSMGIAICFVSFDAADNSQFYLTM